MVKFVELSETRCGEISLAVLRRNVIAHSDWGERGEWALAPVLGQERRSLGKLSKKMDIPISTLEHFRDILLGEIEDNLSEEEKVEMAWAIYCNTVEIYPNKFHREFFTGSSRKRQREIGNVAKEIGMRYDELISFIYLLDKKGLAAFFGIEKAA